MKLYLAAVYLALWGVVVTAPAGPSDTSVVDLFMFRGPDPWSVAVFNLMGVWPLLFAGPLLADGPGQRVPAWPFVVLSFAAGAFVLTPYLLLRRWDQPDRTSGWLVRASSHPLVAVGGALASLGLVAYAANGAWSTFAHRLATDPFVRIYTSDFVAFGLLFPAVAFDDRRRRGLKGGGWTVFVPLFGAALHGWRRGRTLPPR